VRLSSCASVLALHMLVGPNVARVRCDVVEFCYSFLLTLVSFISLLGKQINFKYTDSSH
jgi:hypothetical protein